MVSVFECETEWDRERAWQERFKARHRERARGQRAFFLSFLKPHQNAMDFKPFSPAHYMLIRFQFEDSASNLNTNWDSTRRRALEIETFSSSFFVYQSELSCTIFQPCQRCGFPFERNQKTYPSQIKIVFFFFKKNYDFDDDSWFLPTANNDGDDIDDKRKKWKNKKKTEKRKLSTNAIEGNYVPHDKNNLILVKLFQKKEKKNRNPIRTANRKVLN